MDPSSAATDRQACQDLMVDYFTFLSARDAPSLAGLFMPDGILARTGSRALELTGAPAIQDFIQSLSGGGQKLYLLMNPRVWLDGADTAHGRCLGLVLRHEEDGDPLMARHDGVVGYSDIYRREPQGWRFARRELQRIANL